jgi:hypothetical protein
VRNDLRSRVDMVVPLLVVGRMRGPYERSASGR